MGAKTWMLLQSAGDLRSQLRGSPALDPGATVKLLSTLFPKHKLEQAGGGDLSFTNPPEDEVLAGCFHGFSVVAATDFAIDYPSRLSAQLLAHAQQGTAYLHAMHSVVDWFAYAIWKDGRLQRSLSLSPDGGVLEDIGAKLPFEQPYWNGEHPALDPEEDPSNYPFPFHPLELGEAALRQFFGYQLEGYVDPDLLQPEKVPLLRFKRSKNRWKFW